MADNNGEIIYYCSECGREYPNEIMYCEHDGAEIKTKKRVKNTDNAPELCSNDNNDESYYLVNVITGERFAIPSGITAVGREVSDALIPLSDSYDEVSRSHANIIFGEGNVRIQNTSTSNGTHVNGQTLSESDLMLLKEGDVIVLGGDIYKKHILCLRLEKGE